MRPTMYPRRASLLEGFALEMCNIVARGASREQWAEWLRVPLEHAAAKGNIDLFNALMEAGADVKAGWRGCGDRSLLDAAAFGGKAEVVSRLLHAGAQPDVNIVSAYPGRPALYLAAAGGHEDAARRLVMAGADVHFRDVLDDCDILFKAADRGCTQLVNELLIAGADPNTKEGRYGNSPLHIAAESGFEGMASALLVRGAYADVKNKRGESPLILAARGGYLAVVNTLLAAGANLNIRFRGMGVLTYAIQDGHVDMIKAIIRHGADVNGADGCFTPLVSAAKSDQAAAVDALVEGGAIVDERLTHRRTPLGEAVLEHHLEAARALLRHGAKVDVRARHGNSLLHLACFSHLGFRLVASVVDLLLRSGADETALNDRGDTPAQMLESRARAWTENRGEFERARRLLARAPNDRAWRRRSWLVVLRSRASKLTAAGCDDSGDGDRGSDAAGGRGGSLGFKVARREPAGGAGSGVLGRAGNGCVTGAGEEEEGERLRIMVESLVGLELEGVFRAVVGFL